MSKIPISNIREHTTLLTTAGPQILSYLSSTNLSSARGINRGFREAVGSLRVYDTQTVVRGSVELWRRSFPNARAINLTGRVLTDADFVHLRGLTDICLSETSGFTDAGFANIAGVKKLSLFRCTAPLTDAALAHITGIEFLNMSYTSFPLTDAGLAHLRGIKELIMPQSSIRSQAVFTDAGLAHLVGIRKLDIDGYSSATLTDAAFEPLCAKIRGEYPLRELDIGRCRQFTERVCKSFRKIKKLSINCLEFTEAALEPLESIHTLDIGLCSRITSLSHLRGRVKDLNMRFCSRIPGAELVHLRGIESLDLSYCHDFGDEDLSHLVGIKKLLLSNCTQPTLTHAAFAPLARSLKVLDISWCRHGEIGDRAFAHFGGLEELNMAVCNGPEYTDACLGMIPRVKKLNVDGCYQLTPLAIQNLARTNAVIEEINFGHPGNMWTLWQGTIRHRDFVEEGQRLLASRAAQRRSPAAAAEAAAPLVSAAAPPPNAWPRGPPSGGAGGGLWPRGPPRDGAGGGSWPRGPPRERRSRKLKKASKKN